MPDLKENKQCNKQNKVLDVLRDTGAASNGAVEISELCHSDGPSIVKVMSDNVKLGIFFGYAQNQEAHCQKICKSKNADLIKR